jgi:dTDP-4-dehydrorhamnose 3,5-epimerase
MKFVETELPGAFIIRIDKLTDERGFFARTWCQREFEKLGLDPAIAQANVSYNRRKGTLRGMHYQVEPYGETKLVRCTQGAIYDVIIDLRPDSCTYRKWIGIELTADNYQMIFVPKMFAHGFQSLADDSVLAYQVGQFYTPVAERGIRYDDAAFNIKWPLEVSSISAKDKSYPDFVPESYSK